MADPDAVGNNNEWVGREKLSEDLCQLMRDINELEIFVPGSVYISGAGLNRIQQFTRDGTFIGKWGSSGSGEGEFDQPIGIAIDSSGFVYVTDRYNHRVQKFDRSGAFTLEWGSLGAGGGGEFQEPWGIAVDADGFIYVSCILPPDLVQKFQSDGTFVTEWGGTGTGDGEFDSPYGVAVGPDGFVYVADGANDRIQKFQSDGTFVSKWGSFGSGDGQFNSPHGIVVSSDNFVYVGDSGNGRIQKFQSDGTFVSKWGSGGLGDGQFTRISLLGIDSAEFVYVADFTRVQKFTSSGTFVRNIGSAGSGDGQFLSVRSVATNYLCSSTTWVRYLSDGSTLSLGAPDAGRTVPDLNALYPKGPASAMGANVHVMHGAHGYIRDMRKAIEALVHLGVLQDAITGNTYNWSEGSTDNLYYNAMLGKRRFFGQSDGDAYNWTRLDGALVNSGMRDIDVGEVAYCVRKLQQAARKQGLIT